MTIMMHYESCAVLTTNEQRLMGRLQWAVKVLCSRARVGAELLRLQADSSTLQACLVDLAGLCGTVQELSARSSGRGEGFEGFFAMAFDLQTYIHTVLASHRPGATMDLTNDTDLLPELDGWAQGERNLGD